MSPDDQLLAAWEALRAGRHAEVLEQVGMLDTPELRAERPRLVAHALAWKAQVLKSQQQWEPARGAVMEAIRLARQDGDADGLASLRELHAQISASLAALETTRQQEAADRALLQWSEEQLVEGTTEEQAARLLRLAAALLTEGRSDEASQRARQALALRASPREQVLARLSLVRSEPDSARLHLQAAFSVAESVDDQNLIAAVARAAKAAHCPLPAPSFG